jgi:hypothetical protein
LCKRKHSYEGIQVHFLVNATNIEGDPRLLSVKCNKQVLEIAPPFCVLISLFIFLPLNISSHCASPLCHKIFLSLHSIFSPFMKTSIFVLIFLPIYENFYLCTNFCPLCHELPQNVTIRLTRWMSYGDGDYS